MSDKPVASPCNSICSLNDEDICIGCFRTNTEIRDWSYLDNYQRLEGWCSVVSERRRIIRSIKATAYLITWYVL